MKILAALLTACALAYAADYSSMSTDALLKLRPYVTAPKEREALQRELQSRLPTMSQEEMERFIGTKQPEQNGGRGMGDGRIATH